MLKSRPVNIIDDQQLLSVVAQIQKKAGLQLVAGLGCPRL